MPIIKSSMVAVRSTLNKRQRRHCFELFGYDFIIDDELKPWLIEVNTNPCLEESSKLLAMLLPRMLDDLFRLTVDKVFPPLRLGPEQQEQNKDRQGSPFRVTGWPDDENLWGEDFY